MTIRPDPIRPATPPPLFWQRRLVQAVLPWATSLSVHVGLLAVALILLPTLVSRVASQTSKEQIIVPDATLSDSHPGGLPNPGLGNDPSRQSAQESDPTATDSKGWAQRKSDSLSQTLQTTTVDSNNPLATRDRESASLSAIAGGGELSTFGPRGGGGGKAPQSRIFGHGGNAKKIIYIFDGSGSEGLGIKVEVLKIELKNAVANLAPLQAFNVLMFKDSKDGTYFKGFAGNLIMATPNNKARMYDFLDHIDFHNTTDPIPALQEAFREDPQLVYILTDGEFDNTPQVLAAINSLNADKKVRINTVLLLDTKDEENLNKDFEVVMNKIATDNGGVYKKFYGDDF